MKSFRILSFLALLCAATALGHAQNITVNGTVDGIEKGRILLINIVGENQVDTLGSADFTQNTPFTITANGVTEPFIAKLAVAGFSGGFNFIGEPNATFTAKLENMSTTPVSGGTYQNALNAYADSLECYRKQITRLRTEFDSLRAINKFRSASRINDLIGTTEGNMRRMASNFFAANNNIIPAYITCMRVVQSGAGLEETISLYSQLGDSAKASAAGRIIEQRIARLKGTSSGNQAPDFTLNNENGEPVKMSEVKAKIKILDFWASWCGPCRLNNPHLKKLYEEFKDSGLEIIGISLDNKKLAWVGAIKKDGLPWIQVSSLKGWSCDVAKLYNVTQVPTMYVLDENNNIIAKGLREEALHQFVDNYLKNN